MSHVPSSPDLPEPSQDQDRNKSIPIVQIDANGDGEREGSPKPQHSSIDDTTSTKLSPTSAFTKAGKERDKSSLSVHMAPEMDDRDRVVENVGNGASETRSPPASPDSHHATSTDGHPQIRTPNQKRLESRGSHIDLEGAHHGMRRVTRFSSANLRDSFISQSQSHHIGLSDVLYGVNAYSNRSQHPPRAGETLPYAASFHYNVSTQSNVGEKKHKLGHVNASTHQHAHHHGPHHTHHTHYTRGHQGHPPTVAHPSGLGLKSRLSIPRLPSAVDMVTNPMKHTKSSLYLFGMDSVTDNPTVAHKVAVNHLDDKMQWRAALDGEREGVGEGDGKGKVRVGDSSLSLNLSVDGDYVGVGVDVAHGHLPPPVQPPTKVDSDHAPIPLSVGSGGSVSGGAGQMPHMPAPAMPPSEVDGGWKDTIFGAETMNLLEIVKSYMSQHLIVLDMPVKTPSLANIASDILDKIGDKFGLGKDEKSVLLGDILHRESEFPSGVESGFNVLLGTLPYLPESRCHIDIDKDKDKTIDVESDEVDMPMSRPGMMFAFVRLDKAVNLGASDGIPVKFVICVIGDASDAARHVQLGGIIDILMTEKQFHNEVYMAKTSNDVVASFDAWLLRYHELTQTQNANAQYIYEDEGMQSNSSSFLGLTTPELGRRHMKDEVLVDLSIDGRRKGEGEGKSEYGEGGEGEGEEEEQVSVSCCRKVVGWMKKIGSGVYLDAAERYPQFVSDFRDGLNMKVMVAAIFLFFAMLAPSVAFGGLLGARVGGEIGTIEMIIATSVIGVLYGFTAGQPLVVMGGTGPILVFTGLLYDVALSTGVPFLSLYGATGISCMVWLIVLALTNAAVLLAFFTRFTDEIFSVLISMVFVYEAGGKLLYPLLTAKHSNTYDIGLLSLILGMGTVVIAMILSDMRKSKYLVARLRAIIGDSGVLIAVGCMTAIDIILGDVKTEKLIIPSTFAPTTPRPSWLISFEGLPGWTIALSIPLGGLVAVLAFMDQLITQRIVAKPENNLKKSLRKAYHLDLLLTGLGIGACSLFGLPWLVAATVRSLNHVSALATSEPFIDPNTGHQKMHIVHVHENRVSPILVNAMIGLSLLFVSILSYIPLPVLYGLFLYMGIKSLNGVQLFDRIKLLIMDPALFPPSHYVRRVRLRVIHTYTLIQVVCLAVLWVVKTSIIGIVFPVFLALLVVVKAFLGLFFAKDDLDALDFEETAETGGEDQAQSAPGPL